MKKPVIAIDFDDCIVSTMPRVRDYYHDAFGIDIPLKDIYSSDPAIWQAPSPIAISRVDGFMMSREYQSGTPFSDALTALPELARKYELHVVTGRPDPLEDLTIAYCDRYFPGIFTSYEFTNHFGATRRPKAQVCADLGATYLIDDHLHHADGVALAGTKVLLFGNYPWNEREELHANITRVRDWAAVLKLLA